MDRDELAKIEKRLEAYQAQLSEANDTAQRTVLQRCVTNIEIMLPVYRSFVEFFERVLRSSEAE